MQTLLTTRIPLDSAQADQLRRMLASPAYAALRDVIAAHCALHQVTYMNTALYNNENAEAHMSEARTKAIAFNAALDVLDELARNSHEWFRIELKTN